MKKYALILSGIVLYAGTAFSQLSIRENDASTFKIGTRPGSGDMALTFGVDFGGGGVANLDIVNQLSSGDLLTFKYYLNQKTAVRVALRLYKDSEKIDGEAVDGAFDPDFDYFYKNSEREITLVPGLEKHFSNSNIFDVYVGGDLYLGLMRDVTEENVDNINDSDYSHEKSVTPGLVAGLGGVVGVSVFVAQLPLSIGIEYGQNIKYTKGTVTKVKNEYSVGGTVTTQEYQTTTSVPGQNFSKVKRSAFGMDTNNNVRIVLNIYFGN